MKLKKSALAVTGIALLCLPLSARTQSNIPAPASGQLPRVVPLSEAESDNVAEFHITLRSSFDDGALSSAGRKTSDFRYSVFPSVAFMQKMPRFTWSLSYAPGVDISQRGLYADQFSHVFGGQMALQPTRRASFSIREEYLKSADPFAQLGQGIFESQPGPTGVPNQTLVLPNYTRTEIFSAAAFSYLVSDHTTFGINGRFGGQNYKNLPSSGPAAALIHSQMVSGGVYLSHQVSQQEAFGVQYDAQNLKFVQQDSRTFTHSILFFDQFSFTPNSILSVYAGPAYSLTRNQAQLNFGGLIFEFPVIKNSWSPSAGAIYFWRGERSSVEVQFTRRVTDGQGLLGAIYLDAGSAEFTQRLTPRWDMSLGINGGRDDLIGGKGFGTELRTYGGNARFSRRISQNVALSLFYQRINQSGSLANQIFRKHDIAGVSLEYSLLRPLGR